MRVAKALKILIETAAPRCDAATLRRLRLLLDDRDQPVPHHLHTDFKGRISHCTISLRIKSKLPSPCITTSNGEVTTVEVSRSTITTGPAMRSPSVRLALA